MNVVAGRVPSFYVTDWSMEKLGFFYVWKKDDCYA
jgi:hypothetical protein